jgi:predicted transcriptional regulator
MPTKTPTTQKTKVLTVRIDADLLARMQWLTDRHATPISAQVRRALIDYLDNNEVPKKPTRKAR